MNKKSQGLSINVIIIVAIALIVLVVLIAIFTGRLGTFTSGLKGAVACDDICKAAGFGGTGETQHIGLQDSDNNVCSCAS